MLGIGSDYVDNAREAALLVGELVRGRAASEIPLHATTKMRRSVNLENARRLGIAVPAEWIKSADLVVPARPRS
jgi:ABC-type uncharacterized transport system substrate-binding protein